MNSRRRFLQASSLAGAGLLVSWKKGGASAYAQAPPLNPLTLTKYKDPLPIPGVMQPVVPGGNYYQVGAYQISQRLHSDLPLTTVWGYGTSQKKAGYPAATFEVKRGVPIQVKWTNNLFGVNHPLPVDQTLHWADPLGQHSSIYPYSGPVPIVTHVHGGEQESASDGHPDAWFTPGYSLVGKGWVKPVYNYTNEQPPTTLWYHDHALGITRLNVYMGLAGFYLIRDPQVEGQLNLPSGAYEIPLVIQDRSFNADGSLAYPNAGVNPQDHPYWTPEFFGDTILVNGKIWPYLQVKPRRYRFRILNGSNARFYNLSFPSNVPFYQIGTDGGYLSAPVALRSLMIAPGERADMIVDFTGLKPGTSFILTNSAPAPFPMGIAPDRQLVGQIMKFQVVAATAQDPPDTSVIPDTLSPVAALTPPSQATRTLTLNEVLGPGGPLGLFLDGKMWNAPLTERPKLGSTELWEIVNLTGDTHPIHLHLTQFQLLNRHRFNTKKYLAAYDAVNPVIPMPMGGTYTTVPVGPYLQDGPLAPDANEAGWKDTVRMNPGEVTRILVRFAPIGGGSYPFDATAGPGYVWHCHILEHEDNEMMRPYKLVR